jgi:hypothetical protein
LSTYQSSKIGVEGKEREYPWNKEERFQSQNVVGNVGGMVGRRDKADDSWGRSEL